MTNQIFRSLSLRVVPVFVFILVFSVFTPVLWAGGFTTGERPPVVNEEFKAAFVPGQILVKFKSETVRESVLANPSFKLYGWENAPYGYTRLFIDGDVPAICVNLNKTQGVEVAEPNYLRYLQVTPNDPLFFRQENLKLSNAESAWNIETGDSSVTVAVIDTGVDLNHPDLKPNILLTGKNFIDTAKDASDDSGHGTAVSGVIAAVGNNGVGVCGAGWNVKILPLRACGGPNLTCSVLDEVEAIQEAIAQGADIINLSLGGFGSSSMEEGAVNDAWDAGLILFAAAGNHGLLGKFDDPETADNINYPAGYANVIGVSSVDYPNNGNLSIIELSEFSNSGDAVSVTAVGSDVVTTAPSVVVDYLIFSEKADYGRIDGTSFSTPLVSGMAAVIKSHFPNINNVELRTRIQNSVNDIGPAGWDNEFGYGVIDFKKALSGSTYAANPAFNFGVTTNPILNDEIIFVIKTKVTIDGSPVLTYMYYENAMLKSGSIPLIQSPSNSTIWTGRFNTRFSGNITFMVNGTGSGSPLQELETDYYKGKSN